MKRLVEEEGMALILITHALGVVAGVCERIAVMYGGRFVETAPTDRLFKTPQHPYTEALLEARYRASTRPSTTQLTWPSTACRPSSTCRSPACPFAPRCEFTRGLAACNSRAGACEPSEPGRARLRRPPGRWGVSLLTRRSGSRVSRSTSRRRRASSRPSTASTSTSMKGETLGLVGESGCGKIDMPRAASRT